MHSVVHQLLGLLLSCALSLFPLEGCILFLNVGEAQDAEGKHLVLNVAQEALRDQLLRVVELVVELWVPILTLYNCSAILGVLQVQLILYKHILAEVSRQTFSFLDADEEVNAAIKQVFRHLRQVILVDLNASLLVDRNHVDLELAMRLVVAAYQVDGARIVDQVSQRLQAEVTLTDDCRFLRVCERIIISS